MAHYSLQVQDGAFVSTENKSFFYYKCPKVWAYVLSDQFRVQFK